MDKIGKRLLLSAGIGLGVAVSGVSLYLLFKSDDDYDNNRKNGFITTNHQSVVTIRVPHECVGPVIGRGGERIKRIQSETKTRIQFNDNFDGNDSNETNDNSRYLVIKGSQENTSKAELAINEIIAKQALIITKKFLVPVQAIGYIIGKNGDNIRYLSEKSGAKIRVEKTSKDTKDLFSEVSINGRPEQIEEAQRLIDNEIEKSDRYLRNKSNNYRRGLQPSPCLLSIDNQLSESEIDFDNYYAKLESTNDNQLIPIYVSAVKTPNEFYVQLTGSEGIKLDHLMEEMTDFYEIEDNRIGFKPKEIKVGDIVAIPYEFDEHWYRARVTSVEDKPYSIEESNVGVFYLDYGDSAFIKYKNICLLKDDLLRRIPFQAIESSLSAVVPKFQIEWTEAAIESFKELTHMALWKELFANKIEIRLNGKKHKYFIEIIDMTPNTNSNNTSVDDWNAIKTSMPLNIGEELIRRGFGLKADIVSGDDSLP